MLSNLRLRPGASPAFLKREVRSQAGNVFKIPSLGGMGAMYFLYMLIMYGNDGKPALDEISGLAVCLGILLLIGVVYYIVYRYTVRKMCVELEINGN